MALLGIDGRAVEVESALGGGLPRTVMVGLPDAALNDAKERCRVAVESSGEQWPRRLVTVNLSPGNLPKHGSHHDLAIAASVLAAQGDLPADRTREMVFHGELGLDGRVRPVPGVLPAMLGAVAAGFTRAVVPWSQLAEALLVADLEVIGVGSLRELVDVLNGKREPRHVPDAATADGGGSVAKDLADVVGQPEARWALEVAAAGGHHLYLHGPPGVGKTMLAERLPGLLPPLTREDGLDVTAVHSLAGLHGVDALITVPPFAAPHHSATPASIVGGGSRVIRPGAVSLAHAGVLFLDEGPEFSSRVLESLRVPLESGQVTITRAHARATFPARCQLVVAANPCPCGNRGTRDGTCVCTPVAVRRYAQRLSGPILDRIDIHQWLPPVTRAVVRAETTAAENTATVAARVAEARQRQQHRLGPTGFRTNAGVPGPVLRRELPLPKGIELVDRAVDRGRLSPRGVDKVLRVAWTVADLQGRQRPERSDLAMALALRQADQAVAA